MGQLVQSFDLERTPGHHVVDCSSHTLEPKNKLFPRCCITLKLRDDSVLCYVPISYRYVLPFVRLRSLGNLYRHELLPLDLKDVDKDSP
jgi:hypothetical protein